MKEPDLSRYEAADLEHMLYSYRSLAARHLDGGHWALAKWASRMATLIVIRLGELDRERQNTLDHQLRLTGEET